MSLTKEQYQTKFFDLPEWVKDEVLADKTIEINEKIIQDFRLNEEQTQQLFAILRGIIFKEMPITDLDKSLKVLSLSDEITKNLATEIQKNRLDPLKKYFDGEAKPVSAEGFDEAKSIVDESSDMVDDQVDPRGGKSPVANEIIDDDILISEPTGPNKFLTLSQKIITALSLHLDVDLAKRLEIVLTSYLKDIRGQADFLELLSRPTKIGGLGLSPDQAKKVLEIAQNEKEKPQTSSSVMSNNPAPMAKKPGLAGNLKSLSDITSSYKKKFQPQTVAIPPKISSQNYLSLAAESALPQVPAPEVPEEISAPQEPLEIKQPEPPTFLKTEANTIQQESAPSSSSAPPFAITKIAEKEKTVDVAQTPKTKYQTGTLAPNFQNIVDDHLMNKPSAVSKSFFPEDRVSILEPKTNVSLDYQSVQEVSLSHSLGPIDELGSFSIDDWRRYKNSNLAAQKIEEKVILLGEESISKKYQGIQAWKQSPVNQLYLTMGREALETDGVSIAQLIEQKQKENNPYLTLEEFEAVAELNQKLHF